MNGKNNNDGFVAVASINDVKDREIYSTKIEGQSIVFCKNKGTFYAVENLCTHAASTFDDGRVKGCFIICPLHGVMFDMRNGKPKGTLTKKSLRVFDTRISEQSMLEVDLGSL